MVPAEEWPLRISSRQETSRGRSASRSRWSSSPIGLRAGAHRLLRGSSTSSGCRWSTSCADIGSALAARRRPLLRSEVACGTAGATGAVGVLCLAFPLQPPQGRRPSQGRSPRCCLLPSFPGASVRYVHPPSGARVTLHRCLRSAACPPTCRPATVTRWDARTSGSLCEMKTTLVPLAVIPRSVVKSCVTSWV